PSAGGSRAPRRSHPQPHASGGPGLGRVATAVDTGSGETGRARLRPSTGAPRPPEHPSSMPSKSRNPRSRAAKASKTASEPIRETIVDVDVADEMQGSFL